MLLWAGVWIILAECAAVLAVCLLPDRRHWKPVLILLLLAAGIGGSLYSALSPRAEQSAARRIHEEACARAEKLIRSGRKSSLASALRESFFPSSPHPENAAAFLKQVRSAETESTR